MVSAIGSVERGRLGGGRENREEKETMEENKKKNVTLLVSVECQRNATERDCTRNGPRV